MNPTDIQNALPTELVSEVSVAAQLGWWFLGFFLAWAIGLAGLAVRAVRIAGGASSEL